MALKITPEHLATMRGAIQPLDTVDRRLQYSNRLFPRADRCLDVNKRYRWDLLWMAFKEKWVCDTLYPYLNDTHIDSALRSIIYDLE